MLATQSPVATDLRLISALLHVMKNVERMGDQCVNICKVIPLTGNEPPADEEMVKLILGMGKQTGPLISAGEAAFAERDVDLARPRPPGRRGRQPQPRVLPDRARDRRRSRTARVGDDDAARRPRDRADRRQRRRHRRAGRLRRHRPLPRVRGRLAPGRGKREAHADVPMFASLTMLDRFAVELCGAASRRHPTEPPGWPRAVPGSDPTHLGTSSTRPGCSAPPTILVPTATRVLVAEPVEWAKR